MFPRNLPLSFCVPIVRGSLYALMVSFFVDAVLFDMVEFTPINIDQDGILTEHHV